MEKLKPMPWLKELGYWSLQSSNAMRAVLRNCPELVKLDIHKEMLVDLNFIANANWKLKILAMDSIGPSRAKFQNLQSLELRTINNADDLLDFLTDNRTVEKLAIKRQNNECDNLESLGGLIFETNLKQVKIEGDEAILREITDMFEGCFATWKAVKLEITSGSLQINIRREKILRSIRCRLSHSIASFAG